MKKLFYIFVLAVLLFATGCIEIKTVVNINPDGTGTIEETMLMSSDVVKMFSGFAGSFSDDSTAAVEEFSLFKEDELKDKASDFGSDVAYVSGKELKQDS